MTMRSHVLCIITLLTVSVFLEGNGSEIYSAECQVWERVTQLVEEEPSLNVECQKNVDCTGFDCTGQYIYQNILSGNRPVKRDVCFGVDLHPCNTVKDMTVYVDVQNYGPYLENVTRDITPRLDGRENIGLGAYVQAHLKIEFEVEPREHKHFAKIEIVMTPVFHSYFGSSDQEDNAVNMVPEIEVPIPSCRPGVSEIIHKANQCVNMTKGHQAPQVPYVAGTENCTVAALDQCDENQYCQQVNATSTPSTACVCVGGFYYNTQSRGCVEDEINGGGVIVIDDGIMPTPPSKQSKSGKKSYAVIAGSVIASVCFLAILGLAALFVYRRYRRIHSSGGNDTEPVINNQDDDDAPLDL